mmetsp:Transcript_16824/g.21934  ORF Transcript_16824/g.21934 Transcript_16824/m.21934 type:complete len:360 (+) Transcript_16824:230-1309(+)|eukprot:CAMPEP_0198142148 /NCGR_PEP_ID=MMETSP1443-20131203/5024_1 /TAXON_ID=186043 /ORGANISM="Entomoneis sp., Strain CCMP2396" /LENGTH=359 /DNA_ID=CAMNT_0043805105 /DNA_START=183 /DNA_END=1262 /DNA_ORIENTATION=+
MKILRFSPVTALLALSIIPQDEGHSSVFFTSAFTTRPLATNSRRRLASTELFVLQEKITSEEIQSRLTAQLSKLREKDRASKSLAADDVDIIHEDEHIIVVNKPAGVLSVPSEEGIPSLAQAVFEKCQSSGSGLGLAKFDQMVVHRLGMDTSGLIVFAKNLDAVRGLNALFRTRKITRQYECLVAGHVQKDQGLINLPLMRDYEHPPYMRVSTDEHQAALVDLDAAIVGKKLLEAEKASVTHYQTMSRESFNDQEDLPITRMTLTSISGRTHQLNVHCAAFGHPIVGDAVYGWGGDAAPYGGLDAETIAETAPDRASDDLQKSLASASTGSNMCVHAKLIRFRHPATGDEVEYTSKVPF